MAAGVLNERDWYRDEAKRRGERIEALEAERDAWRARALDAEQRLAEVERQRDAYKRAKAENDDRFMRERDEARSSTEVLLRELSGVRDTLSEVNAALAEATRTVEAMRPVVDAVLRWDGYASGTNESLLEDAVDAYRATSGTVQHTMADGGSGPTTGANCLCHLDNAVTRISCPLHGDYKETP